MNVSDVVAPRKAGDLGVRAYIVAVLWMRGHSVADVARVVDWSRGQVRGFVNRRYKKRPRAHLSDAERQTILDELKEDRRDGRRLRDEHFRIGPRAEAPNRHMTIKDKQNQEPPPEPDLNTRAGRKEAKQRQKERLAAEERERKLQAEREAGHAPRRGREGPAGKDNIVKSSALEFLFEKRLLKDPTTDSRQGGKSSEEQRRHEAGLRLRSIIEGTRIGGLGAIDYERATMGGGSGARLGLAPYKLQCIHAVWAIRQMLRQPDFALIEAVVDQDDFLWEREPARSKARARIYERIRYLLDVIAVNESLMERAEFRLRWGEDLLVPEERSRSDVASQAENIENFLQQARRA